MPCDERGAAMTSDFNAFKDELSLSRDEIYRELYRKNTDLIRIKKEHVSIKNQAPIIESTLRQVDSKVFHAMSLRDLGTDSGLSVGDLDASLKNKGDLTNLIQTHGCILHWRPRRAHTLKVPTNP